ncbi:MAG: type II toxin-antitoxin system VapC family toxin [Treponema sp.]|jgi:PIN domain nuclease of toxin-antitoxin system|nr:type II toxin-antitoxin system VapC family toxin [Treponema sp.]
MKGYLLDTHAAIWFFNGSSELSSAAGRIIRDLSNPVYLSIASVWELAIKISAGKLDFAGDEAAFKKARGFVRLAEANQIAVLPIETAHLDALEGLPWIHRDPFDRLLIAAARAENMTLVSADRNIARYDVSHIW